MSSSDNGTNGSGSQSGYVAPQLTGMSPTRRPQEISLQEILEKIYRRKGIVILVFASVFLVTALYTFLQRPVYEATAQVLIQKSRSGSGSILGGMSDVFQPFQTDERRIINEMNILQTNLLRTQVAQELVGHPTITVDAREDTMETMVAARRLMESKRGPKGGGSLDFVKAILRKEVSFSNDRNSDVIRISVRTHSPLESARIANIYAQQYFNLNLNSSRNMATSVRQFLERQLEEVNRELATAESKLQEYMQSQGIVLLDDEAKKLIEVISSFQAQRDNVVVQMGSEQRILDAYKDQLTRIEPVVTENVSDAVDPYIALLQQQIAKLEVNRDVAIAQNPVVGNKEVYYQIIAQTDSQIADLRRKLKAKTTQFLNAQVMATGSPQGALSGSGTYDPTGYYKELKLKILQQEITLSATMAQKNELDQIVADYDTRFSKIPGQYIELAKLDRTEKSREKLFLLIQDSYQQAQIAEQSQFGYVQIVDPAVAPTTPVSPKVPLNLTLGVLLGLAIGLGMVFVLDYMDKSVKSPEELEKRGLSVLASIPIIAGTNSRGRGERTNERVMKDGVSVPLLLVTYDKPSDPISEAYRSLRTAIQYSKVDSPLKTLLVVSALPKDGKSTTVANIAVTFARAGLKTLMLDSDLRRPVLHKLFNCDRKPGLMEYLKGEKDLDDVIRKTFVENLFLLPTGPLPPNPSEVLGSQQMKRAMDSIKSIFDFIVIDSPPIVAVTDGVILSRMADGVLFVTLANRTEADVLDKAYATLKQVKAGIIGVVLNEFDVSKAYGAYYKYYRYYHYYGHMEEKTIEKHHG